MWPCRRRGVGTRSRCVRGLLHGLGSWAWPSGAGALCLPPQFQAPVMAPRRAAPACCRSAPLLGSSLRLESCPGKLIAIQGKAGLFLEGQIHPELEGVEIVISEKGASSPLITVFTDDKGAYR